MKTKNLLRVPRLSVLLLLFLLGTGPIFAQWLLEANLGINIFDFTQSKYYLTYSIPGLPDSTAETNVTMPTMPAFGATVLYGITPDMFVGGEFSFFSNGSVSNANLVGTGGGFPTGSIVAGPGTSSNAYVTIGPVLRYYFLPVSSGFRPFVGAAFDYVHAVITPPTSTGIAAVTLAMLEAAAMVGATMDVASNVYLGLAARFALFFTVSPGTMSNWFFVGDEWKASQSWFPASLDFYLGFKI